MSLKIVGCSHHRTSIEVRERLAFTPEQIPVALAEFRERFPDTEAVLLSTCNRTEFYAADDFDAPGTSHEQIVEFLATSRGLSPVEIVDDLFLLSGAEAVRHLFTVAASLDSMVVGESQILAQVKQAYRLAADGDSAGQLTHAVFQAAIRVAKRVATDTSIHHKRVSIPSVAIGDFARQIFERLDDKKILVIGAGEMAQDTVQYLLDSHARDISVVNRSWDKAQELADTCQGHPYRWEDLDGLLAAADLVVSSTGATEPIVTLQRYRSIEARRFQRPLFIVDLAVPRDFDPAIADCLSVYLYSIDDLRQACEANRRSREREWPQALRIIDDETQRFLQELQHRATGPTIRRLKENANRVKELELTRLLQKLKGLEPGVVEEIHQSFDRLVNKLLHPPLESLREDSSHDPPRSLLEALRRLFQI
ncbi:MAG: glutamyl-tRNA reductase [Pirellulaceae bacterium]|nr:glutamyl-tRNA reductase [Planctomycetales bacterium]